MFTRIVVRVSILLAIAAAIATGVSPVDAQSKVKGDGKKERGGRIGVNALIIVGPYIGEKEFAALVKDDFAGTNMRTLIAGLNKAGQKVGMPKTAKEYASETYPAFLRVIKSAGATHIEIPVVDAPSDLDLLQQRAVSLGKAVKEAGLTVSAVGMTGEDPESLKPQIIAAAQMAKAAGQVQTVLAGPIGLPFLGFPKGADNKPLPGGPPTLKWVDEQLEKRVKPMRQIGEFAEPLGVNLAIEPLQRFELPGLVRLSDAWKWVKTVNHPRVGLMVDSCHEMCDGEGPEIYRALIKEITKEKKLFHSHISPIHRGKVYEGHIDWAGIFGPIVESGYDGAYAIETFDSAMSGFADAVRLNRPVFQDPVEVTVRNIRYSLAHLPKKKG